MIRLIKFACLVCLLSTLLTSCATGAPAPTFVPVQAAAGQELIPGVSKSAAISLSGKWHAQKVSAWSEQGFGELEGTPGMVVYRTEVDIPRAWKDKAVGISAWFNPFNGRVFVNGTAEEPVRKPFEAYADVSELLKYGESNTIAVTTMYEGYSEFTESGGPRIGLIDQIAVTAIQHEETEI